jgi:aldehyde dehydrogenase (NAD+)
MSRAASRRSVCPKNVDFTSFKPLANITPVLLELGGQNPELVDATANIPDAAKKIVWGAMAWGGQWCTSPGYAYVHESVAGAFVAEAKKAVVELYGNEQVPEPLVAFTDGWE